MNPPPNASNDRDEAFIRFAKERWLLSDQEATRCLKRCRETGRPAFEVAQELMLLSTSMTLIIEDLATGLESATGAPASPAPAKPGPAIGTSVKSPAAEDTSPLGRYQIERELGRGAMAIVYEAHDSKLDRRVALKVLSGTLAGDMDRPRFEQEARSLAKLGKHANVVGIYDVGSEGDIAFFTMELVQGESLDQWLGSQPRSLREIVTMVAEAARGLGHVHAHGVLHRDVKPQNILVANDGRCLVGDFGLARPREVDTRLTATGMILGTPIYMAPEQGVNIEDLSPAADVYALGVVLYEALCGDLPFNGESVVELLLTKAQDDAPPLRSKRPDLPVALEAMVMRCLDRRRERRYADGAAFAQALDQWLETKTSAQPPRLPPAPAAPPAQVAPPRKLVTGPTLVTAATVCVFAAMGLVAIQVDRHRAESKDQATLPPAQPASGADVAVQVAILKPATDLLSDDGVVSVEGRIIAGNAKEVWIGTQPVEVSEGRFEAEVSLEDGRHQLVVRLEPEAEPLASVRIRVDTSAPLVSVTAPTAGVVTSSSLVLVRGTVEDAHLETVQLSDGTPLTLAEEGSFHHEMVLPDQDGEVVVELVARDRVGNETRHPIRLVVDRTPPRIVLDHEETLVSAVGAEVTLQGRVEDAHPGTLLVDGQARSLDADGRFHVSLDVANEGSRETLLQAQDTVGLRSPEQRVSIIGDGTPPRIEIEEPLENLATQNSQVSVRGRVADTHGVDMVTVQGQTVVLASDGAFSTSVPVTEGETRIEVVAEDAAGNRTSLTRTVTQDLTPPTIRLLSEIPKMAWGRDQRRLAIKGTVDEPGCTVTVNGEPATLSGNLFEALIKLSPKENLIEIVARDRAGNQQRETAQVVYHTTKPKLPEGTWWKPTPEQLTYAKRSKRILWFENAIDMRLVLIPPGKFLMGRPEQDRTHPWAATQHPVTLTQGFYIGATEVTHGQFRHFRNTNSEPFQGRQLNHPNQPVTFVSWDNCQRFCQWLTEKHGGGKLVYRLATEAEWEYACRAGTTTRYFWGTNPDLAAKYANGTDEVSLEELDLDPKDSRIKEGYNLPSTHDDGFRVSAPVGSFQPNPWGLFDMIGNVIEWCQDRMGPNSGDAVTNPLGPDQGAKRVIRGGSWMTGGQKSLEASRRSATAATTLIERLGFRVVAVPAGEKRR